MTDDRRDQPPTRPVTSMSLRAERLRVSMARAAGAKQDTQDPGLSAPKQPRDPTLTNRFAVAAVTVGVVAVFVDVVGVPSIVALVFAVLGLRRSRELDGRGKGRFGRRRCLWAIGFAVFGLLQLLFGVFLKPLL